MKKNKLILIVTTMLFISSCFLPEPTPDEEYYMSEEFKSYVMHPVGSWWVYKDSVSGQIDTVILEEQSTRLQQIDPHIMYEHLYQKFNDREQFDFNNLNHVNTHYYLYYERGYFAYTDISTVGDTLGFFIYKNHFGTLILDTLTFTDIKHYKNMDSESDIFWKQNIGAVKLKINNSDSIANWTLIDYYINN